MKNTSSLNVDFFKFLEEREHKQLLLEREERRRRWKRIEQERKQRFCLMVIQKLAGILFLLLSAVFLYIASMGLTIEDRDATAVLITIPLGLFLIFTKDCVLMNEGFYEYYDYEDEY